MIEVMFERYRMIGDEFTCAAKKWRIWRFCIRVHWHEGGGFKPKRRLRNLTVSWRWSADDQPTLFEINGYPQ
jgi:hypothetical protein